MKGKSYLLVGLFLGTALGWFLGYLQLPHLEKNASFLLGFLAGVVVFSLVLLLMMAWKSRFLPGPASQKASSNIRLQTILSGVVVLGSLVTGLTFYLQNQAYKRTIQHQDKSMQDMAAWVASAKHNDHKLLINSVLNDVSEALKTSPGKPLNDTTFARLVAVAFACKPHPYFEGDSLSEKAYSPERGQLLQALVLLQLDTASFARIKQGTTFAGADLQGADLKGLDLSGIHLNGANLKDADLSGANLQGADLREANLWGSNLNRANLNQTDLRRADLGWAQLNDATLVRANLDGVYFTNAQLMKADLNEATLQWAQAGSALFNGANMTLVNCTGTNFTKANLSGAIMNFTDLRRIHLQEADLTGAQLNKAFVESNWLDKLNGWRPLGMKGLLANYTVANDTTDAQNRPMYRLGKN